MLSLLESAFPTDPHTEEKVEMVVK
jgi:hypothetical protein